MSTIISSSTKKIDSTLLLDREIPVDSWIWEMILAVFPFGHCNEILEVAPLEVVLRKKSSLDKLDMVPLKPN